MNAQSKNTGEKKIFPNKIAFLTEMAGEGKVPETHENMRVEFAWMNALNATHYPLDHFGSLADYDLVIIIWPKGKTYLNATGEQLTLKSGDENILEKYLNLDIINTLKQNNKQIAYMQEGPAWFSTDYTVPEQFQYFNRINESDIIFCHNSTDVNWYKGMFPGKDIRVMQTLMNDTLIKSVAWRPENKVMIGGNFCRWYGGFQSYVISLEFGAELWIPTMHNKRMYEDKVEHLNHLSYMSWLEWMKTLSTFKYAVHLMPTSAAGTFSLNCAYFGIPCIGNEKLDTQRLCFPDLSVDAEDIHSARINAQKLKNDDKFYKECSEKARDNFSKIFNVEKFKGLMNEAS